MSTHPDTITIARAGFMTYFRAHGLDATWETATAPERAHWIRTAESGQTTAMELREVYVGSSFVVPYARMSMGHRLIWLRVETAMNSERDRISASSSIAA